MSKEPVRERSGEGETSWDRNKSNIKTIVGAVALALLIRIVLFEAFEIDGPSMEPTLLHGDRVVVAKFMYGLFLPFTNDAATTWGGPNVGDVVIVRSPADNIDIVKRVIATAGDSIEISDDEIIRNGRSTQVRADAGPCPEEAAVEDPSDCMLIEEGVGDHTWFVSRSRNALPESYEEQRVPPDHIYVLGDHRDRSNDSRNPRVGMIPISRVKGRALTIYWSNANRVRWERIFDSVR